MAKGRGSRLPARGLKAKSEDTVGYTVFNLKLYSARSSRAGKVTMAHTNSSAPPTAIPMIRNGSRSSHTKGYSTSATSANGQQNTSRMHHNRNFIV